VIYAILRGEIMDREEKIITFKNYDTLMEANLAKTKLDAYGIPCFLSGENLANLYPIQNPKFSGVRLHLFEKDMDQARQVLHEGMILSDHEQAQCPRCRSTQIEFGFSKKSMSTLAIMIRSIFVALFPPKKQYHCLDCDLEF
jgi:hypothetical protein